MAKPKKGQKKKNYSDDEEEEKVVEEPKTNEPEEDDDEAILKSVQPKKKKDKKNKKKNESDDDEEEKKVLEKLESLKDLDDDEWETHTQKNKKKKKKEVKYDFDDDEEAEEPKVAQIKEEEPKKKPKKKDNKKKNAFDLLNEDEEEVKEEQEEVADEDLEEEIRKLEAELKAAGLEDEDFEEEEQLEKKVEKKVEKVELSEEEKKAKKKEEQKKKKEKEKAEKLKKQQEEEAKKKKEEKQNQGKKKNEPVVKQNKKGPNVEAMKAELEAKKKAEEEARKRAEEEAKRLEEQFRLAEIERKRIETEKLREKKEKLDAMKNAKKKGTFLTKKQIEQQKANEIRIEQLKKQGVVLGFQEDKNKPKKKPTKKKETTEKVNVEKEVKKQEEEEDDMGWEDLADSDDEKQETKTEVKPTEVKQEVVEDSKFDKKKELRSPICVVLGHVDTGKTKILDKIRRTNVQDGEAGGITQQIGATFVPLSAIEKQTEALNEEYKLKLKIPGLLIIDTPGHESFTNLRTRGSSLCDIAILVVDILHGLENQTLESLQLLRQRKTPFVVALNKVDTCTEWVSQPNAPIQQSLKKQKKSAIAHFEQKVKETINLFAMQGINAELYYKNKDMKNTLNLVPTSAITGEGLPDLLMLMTQLTQKHMTSKIEVQNDEFQCTLLEVKVIPGLGTTIDVILTQGRLREKDKIVICTLNGPVVTHIRALLTPQPLKELRVKGEYVHHKEIYAAQGIKIAGQDLDGAIPGSSLFVVEDDEDIEDLKVDVMKDLESLLSHMSKVDKGVCVQASTLGSLEALLSFLDQSKIPVMGINIGPVHRKDIIKACTMVDTYPEYALILAFDVPITKEATDASEKFGVKVFAANIIYHLFDKFTLHMKEFKEQKKLENAQKAVFPCSLKIVDCFHNRDPITLGVDVVDGKLKIGTPLCIHFPATKDEEEHYLDLGRVASIQEKKAPKQEAVKGSSVAIQLSSKNKTLQYGRHFNDQKPVYSKLTRESIDLLKDNFFDELQHEDKLLIQSLKKVFGISGPMKTK